MRRWLLIVLKATVSGGLIYLLFSRLDPDGIWRSMQTLSWRPAALAVMIIVAQAPVLALRWQCIVKVLGGKISFRQVFRITWVGLFFNQALPASISGDVMRVWEGYRTAGLSSRTSLNSVLLERLSGLFSLILITATTLPMIWNSLDRYVPLRTVLAALLPLSLLGFSLLAVLDRLPAAITRLSLMRPLSFLAFDSRRVFSDLRASSWLIFLGLLSNLLAILSVYVLGLELSLNVTFLDYAALVPAAILATVIPLSIAGWGVREGAMVALFTAVGGDPQTIVVLSLTFGVAMIVAALPGGLVWLLDRSPGRPAKVTELP